MKTNCSWGVPSARPLHPCSSPASSRLFTTGRRCGWTFTLLLLLITGCGAKQEAKRPLPLVQVAEIGQASFSPGIDVVSQLESVTDVVLKPETNGKVVKILVKQGEKVRQGQVLLVLDNVQPAAQLDASIAEARKDKLNAERYTFLADQGAVSRKEQDFYVTQAIESHDRARAARATLGYSYLRAPFDGEIGDLSSVKIGDYVKTGQAITGIVSNSLLWTNMDVPASVANQVRKGQRVLLTTSANPPFRGEGRVVFISPYFRSGSASASSSPNTVLVKAEFPNLTGKLKPGQKVKNRIITQETNQLAVPVQAVLMQAAQPFVYRVYPLSAISARIKASPRVPEEMKRKLLALPGTTPTVLQTPVKLGKLQGNLYPVRSGLAAGDRVVVSNTALLRSGMPVREAPANSPEGP